MTDEQKANWSYINVTGLGFLKGVCCPHHDSVQSNGVLRSDDFDGMMRRQAFPVGICIDDQGIINLLALKLKCIYILLTKHHVLSLYETAALVINGDSFKVIARDGKSKVTKKYFLEDGSIASTSFLPDGSVHAMSELDTIP